MKLANNTVLITGGASGIGLALAAAFAETGNEIIVCGRDEEKLRRAENLLPSLATIRCDLTDAGDLDDLQSRLARDFPHLNLLINNAGIQTPMDFARIRVDEGLIERELQTNLAAHIKITGRLLPLLSAQQESAVVFIGSALGRVPKYSAPVYSAAKAGIHGFANCLRHQLAGSSTRVVEVVPDVVDTAMTSDRAATGKIRPEQLACRVMTGLARDQEQITIGRTALLLAINRFSPALANSLVNGRGPQ
jgi:short-subunit dehydrogenase involved in D-alanine esterification of teichoic acids